MNVKNAKTVGTVHTHTHTHIISNRQKRGELE